MAFDAVRDDGVRGWVRHNGNTTQQPPHLCVADTDEASRCVVAWVYRRRSPHHRLRHPIADLDGSGVEPHRHCVAQGSSGDWLCGNIDAQHR